MENNQNLDKRSDEELVAECLTNPDNFLYIVNRYKEKLFLYIRRISSFSEEDTEDILQEVFVKVYTNLNNFDKDLKFSSWIYRITHNQVISNFRKLKARPEGQAVTIDESGANNLASEIDMGKEVDAEILKEKLNKILSEIDPKYREVLVLKFLEEKSYDEISDIIKKPIGTVGTFVSRGKKQMKDIIEKNKIII